MNQTQEVNRVNGAVKRMTWREKCVVRILLLVARIIGGVDSKTNAEIGSLDNHIRVGLMED